MNLTVNLRNDESNTFKELNTIHGERCSSTVNTVKAPEKKLEMFEKDF
jgi:hypothetical protein